MSELRRMGSCQLLETGKVVFLVLRVRAGGKGAEGVRRGRSSATRICRLAGKVAVGSWCRGGGGRGQACGQGPTAAYAARFGA